MTNCTAGTRRGELACNSNAIRMQFSLVIYDRLNGRIEELRFYDSGVQGPGSVGRAATYARVVITPF